MASSHLISDAGGIAPNGKYSKHTGATMSFSHTNIVNTNIVNTRVTMTAGMYQLEAASFADSFPGEYTLSVTASK